MPKKKEVKVKEEAKNPKKDLTTKEILQKHREEE